MKKPLEFTGLIYLGKSESYKHPALEWRIAYVSLNNNIESIFWNYTVEFVYIYVGHMGQYIFVNENYNGRCTYNITRLIIWWGSIINRAPNLFSPCMYIERYSLETFIFFYGFWT